MNDEELLDAFDEYQRGRGLATQTRHRRRMSLGNIGRFMSPLSITEVRVADVDKWLGRLHSPGTKKAYYSDLVAFFKWAYRRELVASNPMLMTDAPKKPRHLPKPARPEVIATAIAMSNGTTQLMILLGALAGLRVAEIAALSSEDVFLDNEPPVLLVRQGKGGKDRIVPLHPRLVERLRHVQHGWLFPSEHPKHEHTRAATVGLRVSNALTAAGDGQHITAHQLRHYFGTEAARWAKGNLVLVGGLMGHASTDTTMGYVGWTPTDGAEVVARIGSGARADLPDELARARRAAAAS